MPRQPDARDRPLLVGGMHRSGTSFTASLVMSAGVDLGSDLLGANESNPEGHYEDLGFQWFHRRMLTASGLCEHGYTATARGHVPESCVQEARDLVADRSRADAPWGWKEPRTTLFLDFWQDVLPQARHLFVFRRPWEVADSLFRRGDETFIANPAHAFDVWIHYNRLILDFARRHPTRCLVVEITHLIENPRRVFDLVRSRLDVPVTVPADRFRDHLFHRDEASTRAALVRALVPEAWETYLELRSLAGARDEVAVASTRSMPVGDCAVLEWARASRAESELQRTTARPLTPAAPATSRRLGRGMLAKVVDASRRLFGRNDEVAPAVVLPFSPATPATDTQRAA